MPDTQQIIIQDTAFVISTPYQAGHVLAENEADALNQLFAENLRNNFASKVKKAREAGSLDIAALQAQLDDYASSYSFGTRRGGGAKPVDPIEREALKLAESKIKLAVKKKGITLSTISDEQMQSFIDETMKTHGEALRAAAKVIVEQRANLSVENLDLGL